MPTTPPPEKSSGAQVIMGCPLTPSPRFLTPDPDARGDVPTKPTITHVWVQKHAAAAPHPNAGVWPQPLGLGATEAHRGPLTWRPKY